MAKRRKSIKRALEGRIPAGTKLLVAVSGGKDSISLLHSLNRHRRLLKVSVQACHVDHGLRETSASDAVFVRKFCEQLGVPCHVAALPAKPKRANIEGWARELRYHALNECVEKHGLDFIVTAHTANDVAETLLMRLLANKELSGIREFDSERRLLRPLLEITREQVESYVDRYNLEWVEDASNLDTSFVRNRVRHKVIPPLRELFGESIVWSLAERGLALNADYQGLRELVRQKCSEVGDVELNTPRWIERFRRVVEQLPSAIQWRVAQEVFSEQFSGGMGEQAARDLLAVLVSGKGRVQVSRGAMIVVSAKGVSFVRNDCK